MIKKILLGVFTLILFSATVQAQICGSSHPEIAKQISDRAFEVRQLINNGLATYRDDDVIYVPIKYHLISNNAGTTFPKASNILGLHCKLNEEYEEHGIQFYMNDGFNYIQSDAAYENPGDSQITLNIQKVNDAVNVFIGKNSNPPGGGAIDEGVTLGYYSPGNDWLVVKKSEATYNANTLPHELGHFLSLPHPFNGWDCTFWTEWLGENTGPCAPMTAPCSNVEVELQDGSNCETAGDFICDTPPDYNFGFSNNGCTYNGAGCDWNQVQCEPMENNHMGYFSGCADYEFTPGQIEMVMADLNSPQRSFLTFDGGPWSTEKVTEVPVLTEPTNVANYNGVELDWSYVPNAQKYLVQTALNNSFSLQVEEYIVWESAAYITNLLGSTAYYWRVKGFNELSSCGPWSTSGQFTTGSSTTGVDAIQNVSDWTISPNPVTKGNSLSLQLYSTAEFTADVEIVSVSGQVLNTVNNQKFQIGQTILELPAENLSQGLYFVTIRSAQGVLNKRVVVAN